MKHLENFENFNEGKFSNFAAGAAIVGATLWGANTLMNPVTKATAEYRETELVDFPEFFVRTIGTDDNINVSINGDVIGCSFHQGKYNRYTITVEEGTNNVYYKLSTFGVYIYATTNKSNLPFYNSNMFTQHTVCYTLWSELCSIDTNNVNVLDKGCVYLSNNKLTNHYFSVFPNPATSSISINSDLNLNEKTIIEVYSVFGQLIYQTYYKENINIEFLQKGVYFVKIKLKDFDFVNHKLIIN